MIVEIVHPEDPNRRAYVPLRYEAEDDAWIRIASEPAYFENPMDAATVAMQYAMSAWPDIVRKSRLVRALSEHPQFDFHSDGIDSDMVRAEIRQLASYVDSVGNNLERVLHAPSDDDRVSLPEYIERVTKAVEEAEAFLSAPTDEYARADLADAGDPEATDDV